MRFGKAAALMAGFVTAFALGVATGPSMWDSRPDRDIESAAARPVETPSEPAPAPGPTVTPAKTPGRAHTVTAKAAPIVTAPLSEARLHERVKPLLNRGTRMEIAAEGFQSAEQFAMVAHAARNTNVPFVLLKHRVLTEGRTLEDAIRESKPEMDANAEAKRAQMAARSDIAAVTG